MKKITFALSAVVLGLMTMGAGCGQSDDQTVEAPHTVVTQPADTAPQTQPVVTPPTSTPTEPTADTTSTTSSMSTTSTSKVSKLDISQWGVTLQLSKDIIDVHYSLKNDSSNGNSYAYFSSKSLIAKGGTGCDTPNAPLGALVRTKQLSADGPMAAPTNAVKLGDYYYYYIAPQSVCSNDKMVQDLTNSQMKSVEQAAATVMITK